METKKNFTKTAASIVAASFLCVLISPMAAHAGFQWVSPQQEAAAQAPQTTFTTPHAPALVPQIIQGAPSVEKQLPTLAPAPAQVAGRTYEMPIQPIAPAAKVVLGFADNIPLSVALRQVLPSDYGFSVARDVSLGTLVSWKGGDSWRIVMKKMLGPANLAMVEDGQMIKIVTAASLQEVPVASAAVLGAPDKDGFSVVLPSHPIEAPPLAGEAAPASVSPMPMPQGIAAMTNEVSVSSSAPVSLLTPPQGLSVTSQQPFMNRPMPLTQKVQSVSAYPQAVEGVPVWTGARGVTLHNVLQDWCDKAGVELSWQSEFDYPLQAAVSLEGSFEKAVRSLLSGFQEAKPQPVGRLHKNQSAGQAVLVVRARGNNYME